MTMIEEVIRFATTGILALLAILVMRDLGRSWAGRFLACFAVTASLYPVCSYAPARDALEAGLPVAQAVCATIPAFLWLAAQAIFRDEFRPRPWHAALPLGLAALAGLSLKDAAAPSPAFVLGGVQLGLSVGLYGHAVYIAWTGRENDLVKERLAFRTLFVCLSGAVGLAVVVVEGAFLGSAVPARLESTASAVILTATIVLAVMAIRLDGRLLLGVPGTSPARASASSTTETRDADARLLDLIDKAMVNERLYRDERLTIRSFAERLRVPEHRLRRAINRGLGFRNFNAFLNHYRLAEVKASLGDRDRANIPILTLALEAGFGSIAPFNRSFRAATGVTPSEWRRQQLADRHAPRALSPERSSEKLIDC